MKSAFAEIIESSVQHFTAQTWHWDAPPTYGSIVTLKTAQSTIFGVVYAIKTGTLDGHRQPFAYQKTEEELKKEHPHIFEFLITSFSCLILGYITDHDVHYQWAPTPPKIHTFVSYASIDELQRIFASDHYLQLIFTASALIPHVDELLLALLQHQKEHHLLSKQRLNQLLDTFSLLSGNDYRRLKLLLQRANSLF